VQTFTWALCFQRLEFYVWPSISERSQNYSLIGHVRFVNASESRCDGNSFRTDRQQTLEPLFINSIHFYGHRMLTQRDKAIRIVMTCSDIVGYQRFGLSCCFQLQGEVRRDQIQVTLQMSVSQSIRHGVSHLWNSWRFYSSCGTLSDGKTRMSVLV
jgi:hypothetical protein